ncbi:MAG: hypothetical protein H6772_00450 [Pseudomonadales bacterium]|nr:hypothetical protein [Pseudomonadales bacterium]
MKEKNTILSKFIDSYILIFFIVILSLSFVQIFTGFENDIINMYGFRQTQTAISAFYLLKDGLKIDYITPVLGAPWSIPLEFPTYQGLVAIFADTTGIGLDQSGRLVSIFFFYSSIFIIYYLLSNFIKKKIFILIPISLFLANPMYIFWSRSFMMESTAFFFSISFLTGSIYFIKNNDKRILFLTIMAGIFGALTKITTFIIFCFPTFVYLLKTYSDKYKGQIFLKNIWRYIKTGIIIFGAPLLIGISWIKHTDVVKNMNPLAANFITSGALTKWNFGTLSQKFSLSTWNQIGIHTFSNLFEYSNITILILVFVLLTIPLLVKSKYKNNSLFLYLFFLIGPIFFTNLFFTHSYYFYANLFFLILGLSLNILYYLEESNTYKKFLGIILFQLIIILSYQRYYNYFLPVQKTMSPDIHIISRFIKTSINKNDISLIYGYDWDSSIPYYSERMAIMDKFYIPINDLRFLKSLKYSGKNNVKLMVLNSNSIFINEDEKSKFINDRINYFEFDNTPHVIGSAIIYLKK